MNGLYGQQKQTPATKLCELIHIADTGCNSDNRICVRPARSDEFDKELYTILVYVNADGYECDRKFTIRPELSLHVKHGTPDVFCGYRVADTDERHYDSVIANYVSFEQALQCVCAELDDSVQTPSQIREWQEIRATNTISDHEEYDVLTDIAENAIADAIEYHNDHYEDDNQITREDIDAAPSLFITDIIGRAVANNMILRDEAGLLHLTLEDQLFDVAVGGD